MSLQQSLSELQTAFDSGRKDDVTKQLGKLKLQLAQSGLYFAPSDGAVDDLVAARSILELAAFHSLRQSNLAAYRTYNASLAPFYALAHLPASPNRPVIIGLHLLALLSEGQLTDFHTLIERLDAAELGDSFVRLPVDLERWLMEGAYNKVYRARDRVPREEFGFLLEKLMGTVRAQIAATIEASYPSLAKQNAASLLFYKPGEEDQLARFTQERNWTLHPSTSTYTFASSSGANPAAASDPAFELGLKKLSGAERAAVLAARAEAAQAAQAEGVVRGVPMVTMVGPALRLAQQLEAIV